ncbi:MAG: ATP-dependent nuclease [Ardenticatenaceae bacterium]
MKLREMVVKNFRCLVDVAIPITDTTVLVGENNSGKTALLDALRIALPDSMAGGLRPFEEYDYHMVKANDSPETSEGIVIELWFREDAPNEWPSPLTGALDNVIQTDIVTDLDSIGLRLSSKYDGTAKQMVTRWEFLGLDRQALKGRGENPDNIPKFISYVRCFYLSSLRDAANEFSADSQFWGPILRDLKISSEQRTFFVEELTKLNQDLLKAAPKIEKVTAVLDQAQDIMELGSGHTYSAKSEKTLIHALPLKSWELMSKAQVVIKSRGGEIEFPLARHGQGVQSLAVLFLFQAYVDVLLKPTFQPETEAILALEEPEAHLHPQATRALAANLDQVKSQKIVSSHSPYFIQDIPFTQIRMFRRSGPSSNVLYVKRFFTAQVPNTPQLLKFCGKNAKFEYHEGTATISAKGKIEEKEYRKLLTIYPGQHEVHAQLKQLYEQSQLYLSDNDLAELDTYAKRIRGEVLFARAWLLCEGQSEYLLLRYFSELLGQSFDQAGITVIDFQNNGSPGAFVGLARAFEVPWIMVCDNDDEGQRFVRQLQNRGLTDQEIKALVRPLPGDGTDFETFLVKNGFAEEYQAILNERATSSYPYAPEWIIAKQNDGAQQRQIVLKKSGEYELRVFKNGVSSETISPSDSRFQSLFFDCLVAELQENKMRNANALIRELRMKKADATRVPSFFAKLISDIIAKVV